MGIKVVTYGGLFGWFLRKHFSSITSWAYLQSQYYLRKKLFDRYIRWFENQQNDALPCLVSIETVNRCNNSCSFCPANKNAEQRPLKIMSDVLFRKIIGELEEWEYDGYLSLYINNEPLIDAHIEEKYRYAKKHLPKAKMLLFTNGILLNMDRFSELVKVVDRIIINNYSETLKLQNSIDFILKSVDGNEELKMLIEKTDITIQMRYIHEVLTNRAGFAPNKKKEREHHWLCIMPYTDITVYPDGICGMCCSDALEKTCLGDLNKNTLKEIWQSQKYNQIRRVLGKDREDFAFCKGCDFVDAGIRNELIKMRMSRG